MAARGINKVILLGNLGQEPEIKTFTNGESMASFSIATSESWRDKTSGEMREKSEWHRVAIFGKTAEFAASYLNKGNQVYIEGQLQTRKWQDSNGQDRYTTEVIVRWPNGNLQVTGSRVTSESQDRLPTGSIAPNMPETREPTNWDEYEDDIPF